MRNSNIFLTVDAVIVKKTPANDYLLLIKRNNEPFQNCWALPGGFVDLNEDLMAAAIRELYEETTISVTQLEQIGAFGKPFRDPRNHVVSVAYYGEVAEDTIAIAADDAREAKWFSIKALPKLAFDHEEIVNLALQKFTI